MRPPILLNALLVYCCMTPGTSSAEPGAQLLGGVESSTGTSYSYLGYIVPFSGSSLGNGVVTKLWLDWSDYSYVANGQAYDVRNPGADVALGYQQAKETHWWGAYAGMTYQQLHISPANPASNVDGDHLWPKFQVEGEQTLDQIWKIALIGSYVGVQQSYWARARVLRKGWFGYQLGLEAITQGDPGYRANQYGVVLTGMQIGNRADIGFKLGTLKIEGLSSHPYFGVELGALIN